MIKKQAFQQFEQRIDYRLSVPISRPVDLCKTLGASMDDYSRDLTKMIGFVKDLQRPVLNFMLTRYACYLIAQNSAAIYDCKVTNDHYFDIIT
jgi:hypothetical protein